MSTLYAVILCSLPHYCIFLVSLEYFEVYRVCPLRCESAIIEIFHALSDLFPSLKLLSII